MAVQERRSSVQQSPVVVPIEKSPPRQEVFQALREGELEVAVDA